MSMEDLAQSTEVRTCATALEVARARSQDAAERVADLSYFCTMFLRDASTEPRRVSMDARRTAVTRSATTRSWNATALAICASISTFWVLGEPGRTSAAFSAAAF